MKIERFFSPLELIELKEAVSEEGRFSGYVSTYDRDRVDDIILPGAFKKALAKHQAEDTLPAMLWGHSLDQPIGRWESMSEDGYGLFARGKLTLGVRKAREAAALLADNAAFFSIGFTLRPDGSYQKDGIRYIREIAALHEASVVSVPAQPKARLAKARPETRKDFEHLLRNAGGLSARESKRIASLGWRGLARDEQESETEVLAELKKLNARMDILEPIARLITEKFYEL